MTGIVPVRSFRVAVVLLTLAAVLSAAAASAQVTSPSPAHQATNVPVATALSWAADAKATRYDVYVGTTNPPPLAARNQTATTYQPATLAYATTYYWRVNARGSKGYAATGPVWSFTTAAAPPLPGMPTGASPESGATGVSVSPTLSWSASSNATTYDVAFGTSNPPPPVTTGQSTTSYTPAGPLAYAQTYFWRVTANGPGGSSAGAVWSFTTTTAPPPPPSTAQDRLRVMTWNVQSGKNAAGSAAIDAQVALMADSGADVLVLQEVTITPDYGDLTALYRSKLEALTGATWHQVWAPAPRPSNYTPEGNLILTRLPVLTSSTTQFDTVPDDPAWTDTKRSAAAVTLVVNDVQVVVATTHLPLDPGQRQAHLNLLQDWLAGFQAPRLVGGDFNMLQGDAVYADFAGGFGDAWVAVAGASERGYTKDVRSVSPFVPGRIDFWWQEKTGTQARATEAWVVKTSRSDHHAVVVDVEVK